MQLSDDEKRMLDGEEGEIKQKCMQFLVDYGEAAGAERLVEIDGNVDLHPGAHWGGRSYIITPDEVRELVKKGERFKVPTFSNKMIRPGMIFDGWQQCGLSRNCDPKYRQERLEELQPWIDMGMIPTFSCTDYLVSSFWPTMGQHCAWVESSAIPWVNAIIGARSNFDGCFQTAYLGKVPEYDMHVTENRAATVLVRSESPLQTDMDYDLFGWAAGEVLGLDVPAFVGIGTPTTGQIVKMNSSVNTSGNVRMYHIPGYTPEAPTVEAAFQGKKPAKEIVIARADLRRAYELLNYGSSDDVDFIYLGCPHYNIQELQNIAQLLDGKKCCVTVWIMTNPLTYRSAELAGYKSKIEKAGALLMSGTCPANLDEMPSINVIATDAAKQDYYITGWFHPKKVQVRYGTTEDCIDAAITGKWKGGWRG